jgi:hypothetical protein
MLSLRLAAAKTVTGSCARAGAANAAAAANAANNAAVIGLKDLTKVASHSIYPDGYIDSQKQTRRQEPAGRVETS